MEDFRVEVVCRDLTDCVQAASSRLQYSFDREKVYQMLWRVQDELNRLVDCASDSPTAVFSFLQRKSPRLVRDIIGILEWRLQLKHVHSRAIDQSCEEINRLLGELERIKEGQARPTIATNNHAGG